MLDNCSYNQIKLIHDLSNVLWYMKCFCDNDAKAFRDKTCVKVFGKIQKDLEKDIEQLKALMKK